MTEDRSRSRRQIEELSRPTLVKLSTLPNGVVPMGALALVALGLFAPLAVAVPAAAVLFCFFLWIIYLSWPSVGIGAKLMRLVMLGVLVVMMVNRFR